MKVHFLFSLFLLLVNELSAQQITLNGIVTIHNSRYETGEIKYVKDAEIIADFTKPASTDNFGNFSIDFVGIARGTSVDMKVSKTDWEVVNTRELQDVVVGRRTPLKIFLARKGVLAQAQAKLYNVSLKTITARHDRLIAELQQTEAQSQQVIEELEQQLNTTIANRYKAEQLLNEQLTATRRKLPQFARELARTNLDFASQMYREAYEYFEQGEIEKAIETLDEAVLDKQATEAVIQLDNIKAAIVRLDSALTMEQQSLDNYLDAIILKARSLSSQTQYEDAIKEYNTALVILDEVASTDSLRYAQAYLEIAEIYQNMGAFYEELEYRLRHLAIAESINAITSKNMITYYEKVIQLYMEQQYYEKAIYYQEKILEMIDRNDLLPLAKAGERLQSLLTRYGGYLQIKQDYQMALAVYERLYKLRPNDKEIKKIIKQLKKQSK